MSDENVAGQLFEIAPVGEEERKTAANELVAVYVDGLAGAFPAKRAIEPMAAAIRELLEEGCPRDQLEGAVRLAADRGAPASQLSALVITAYRRRERAAMTRFVDEYGWPTGCRLVRGSHAMQEVYDVLGTDRPPGGWPHERPGRVEVEAATNALDALGSFLRLDADRG